MTTISTRHAIGPEYLDLRGQDIGAIQAIQQIAERRCMEPWQAAERLRGIIADRFIDEHFPRPQQ